MEEFNHIVAKPWIERLKRLDPDTQKAFDLDRQVPPLLPPVLCTVCCVLCHLHHTLRTMMTLPVGAVGGSC
jgi:hypothetical protein